VTESISDIKTLFFSPRTIWLLPNDLVRSQFLQHFFDDLQRPDNQQGGHRTFDGPEGLVFPLGRYPRLETFSSLEQSLARELGPPEMDDLGRRLIVYDLARTLAGHLWLGETKNQKNSSLSTLFPADRPNPAEHETRFDWRGDDLKALADELGDGFDRLKLAGLSWDQVEGLPPAALGRILADLGRCHDQLLAGLGRRDRFSRRRQVLEELRAGYSFQSLAGVGEIVCRWSQRLSPFETDFLLALARGRQLKLTLKVPAWVRDENIDHGSGFDLLRSIRRIEECREPTLWLDFSEYQATGQTETPFSSSSTAGAGEPLVPRRDPAPALAYAADVLLAPAAYRRADPPDPIGQLKIIQADGIYQEVEKAGRLLKERFLDGLKAEDLALVVPDLERYGPLIDDISRRFGLAFYFRRGNSLAKTGPARALMDLLALWSSNWERPRLMEFIRNPYFQLGLDPAACHRLALAAGVTDHRAGGGFEENLDKISPENQTDLQTARKLTDLVSRLKESGRCLNESGTWVEFLSLFKKLLKTLGWPGNLSRAPVEPENIRDADLVAAQSCVGELDRLAEVFEQSPRPPAISLADFRLWLETLINENYLSWDKNPEGRVRVLNYHDLHSGFFEEIIFLGLAERLFPKTAPQSRWWPEELVRGAAGLLGRPLWNDPADRYRQEELLFTAALGQARQRVWLFYPAGDENGRPTAPSPLLTALAELWPTGENQSRLPTEKIRGGIAPDLAKVAGPDEMWLALAGLPLEKWPAGWNKSTKIAGVMDNLRLRRERWRLQKNEARLSREMMRIWLSRRPGYEGHPLIKPNFLASFEDCPLAFWGGEILGLTTDGEPVEQWPRTSEGTVVHRVLEKFFQARLGRTKGVPGLPWPGQADYDSCRAELLGLLEEEIDRSAQRDPLGRKPLWELRRARLPETLSKWLRREMAETAEPTSPLSLEWSFGPQPGSDASPWRLETSDGEHIFFYGRADRLDQTELGLSLRDYKLRDKDSFHPRERNGELVVPTNVWPILTYALAASDLLKQKVEAQFDIIEATGLSGRLKILAIDHPALLRPEQNSEPEGFNFPRRLAQTWRKMLEGRFPPLGAPDQQCRWCRLELLCPRRDLKGSANPGTDDSDQGQ